MSDHVYKRHNKTLLLYHVVCPVKYRKKIITDEVARTLRDVSLQIGERYEIHFVEMGTDEDHVHFLVQSIPILQPQRIVQIIKSITAKEIFKKHPDVRKTLWGGQFWTSGYYVNTVGRFGNEEVIRNYVKEQGKEYQQIYRSQLLLFE